MASTSAPDAMPFSRAMLASRESHYSQTSQASSTLNVAETLEQMRQFGLMQHLTHAGTLPPGRTLRLDPIRMPHINVSPQEGFHERRKAPIRV